MASGVPAATSKSSSTSTGSPYALAVLTSLFFLWGFLTCLNDTIIPHLKAVFTLNYAQAMLVQFCFFAAYFLVSIPAGRLVSAVGYKRGILIGLVTAGLGCWLFYPAAGIRAYPIFLTALFILAAGITILQVSANPYVAVLGSPETASSRLTMTQAFNSLGTTVAPLFGAALILSHRARSAAEQAAMSGSELEAYRSAEAAAVQGPYLGLGLALMAVAAVIALTRLPTIESPDEPTETRSHGSAWQHRHLVLGALGIFLYVGAEVSIGSFLVSYFGYLMHFPEAVAARYLTFYWGGAMVGRFVGVWTTRAFPPGRVLAVHALAAASLVCISVGGSGYPAMVAILAVGFCNSIMFPTIFTLAIADLGPLTSQASGILCAAIVGGAILPLLQGLLADQVGVQRAFLLSALAYLYIAFYGFSWKRPATN